MSEHEPTRVAFFFQDRISIRPRITLDLGFRVKPGDRIDITHTLALVTSVEAAK